jgi:hypothetical protein
VEHLKDPLQDEFCSLPMLDEDQPRYPRILERLMMEEICCAQTAQQEPRGQRNVSRGTPGTISGDPDE